MIVIALSYIAISLYVYRMVLTNTILKIFDRTKGNGYIKLQYVTSIDENVRVHNFVHDLHRDSEVHPPAPIQQTYGTAVLHACAVQPRFEIVHNRVRGRVHGVRSNVPSAVRNTHERLRVLRHFGRDHVRNDDRKVQLRRHGARISGHRSDRVLPVRPGGLDHPPEHIPDADHIGLRTVKHDIAKQSNEYEIVDFMVRNWRKCSGSNPTRRWVMRWLMTQGRWRCVC